MRRFMFVLVLASLLAAAGRSLAGDTGTYRILSYRVRLTPHSDGTVAIEYYQKWLVTGGHIPWIAVGTPNSNFTIAGPRGGVSDSRGGVGGSRSAGEGSPGVGGSRSAGEGSPGVGGSRSAGEGSPGAIARIENASQGGWSGVRIDLDNDYRSGQTFEVRFSIVQRGLFHASEAHYELDFTPGYYDRAVTDTLRVGVKFFANLETVIADPRPSLVSNEEMTWEKYGLGPGERFSIHVSFPAGLFPEGMAKGNLKGASGEGTSAAKGVIAFIVVGFIIFIIILAAFSSKGRYSGGHIFYGGMFGRPGSGRSGRGRSAGGGGGFGGASTSCACACVSCACACACAGGGGAGCSRKLEHTCPACGEKSV